MARRHFILPNVAANARVRIDTASGTTSPADIVNDSGQAVAGAILHADGSGFLGDEIYGPADGTKTLYVKTLNDSDAVTATATLSASHSGQVTAAQLESRVAALEEGGSAASRASSAFAAQITTNVAGSGGDELEFGVQSGDVLFDMTNPLEPVALADGVYSIVAKVGIAGGAGHSVSLDLGVYTPSSGDTVVDYTETKPISINPQPISASIVCAMSAGDAMFVGLSNDSPTDITGELIAWIFKIG